MDHSLVNSISLPLTRASLFSEVGNHLTPTTFTDCALDWRLECMRRLGNPRGAGIRERLVRLGDDLRFSSAGERFFPAVRREESSSKESRRISTFFPP